MNGQCPFLGNGNLTGQEFALTEKEFALMGKEFAPSDVANSYL